MFAQLPMYDFPHLRDATDALWAALCEGLRARGVKAPAQLTRGDDLHAQWRDETLLLGQTCGYPYWRDLRVHLEILATPIYAFEGCDGPNHCSFVIARADDPRATLAQFKNARAAVNSFDSNTGMNLFRAAVAPLAQGRPYFSKVIVTGAHAASLAGVVEDRADLAAIDCVSFALLRPEGVKIVARTQSSPALPFVTSRALPQAQRIALREALRDLGPQPQLGLVGVALLEETAYARVEAIKREAIALGYPRLA